MIYQFLFFQCDQPLLPKLKHRIKIYIYQQSTNKIFTPLLAHVKLILCFASSARIEKKKRMKPFYLTIRALFVLFCTKSRIRKFYFVSGKNKKNVSCGNIKNTCFMYVFGSQILYSYQESFSSHILVVTVRAIF